MQRLSALRAPLKTAVAAARRGAARRFEAQTLLFSSSSASLVRDHTCGVEKKIIRDLFMSYAHIPDDMKGSGDPCLDLAQLEELLMSIGERPSKCRLESLMTDLDLKKTGTIDYPEFLLGCDKILAHNAEDNDTEYKGIRDLDVLIETFRTIDRDGDGRINRDDLSGLLSTAGNHLDDATVAMVMEIADQNNDGYIDLEEFVQVINDPRYSQVSWRLRSAFRAILVIGGPGSGKGLLCERLIQQARIQHCSSGDMLREEVTARTPLGLECEKIMKEGKLLPSATVMALLKKKVSKFPGAYVALDGFPRSRQNYDDFNKICGSPEFALFIDVPDEIMIERILKRGEESGRLDDNIDTALKRIETFHAMGRPTLERLQEDNVPVHVLDGSKTPDDVWIQLLSLGTALTRRVL